MTEGICIFEDDGWRRLAPLTSTRPVYDLRLGIGTLKEKIETVLHGTPVALHCRTELADSVEEDHPGTGVNALAFDRCLFVNGRVIADESLGLLLEAEDDTVLRCNGEVVAARVSGGTLEKISRMLDGPLGDEAWEGLPAREVDARLVRNPWDLITSNEGEIARDFDRLGLAGTLDAEIPAAVHVINPDAICIAERCRLDPGVVLDAGGGPVVLGSGVRIGANSVIRGPAVIGEGSLIQPLTVLQATTVGPACKLGGEIRESIIQGYSNKQHSGFLGHAYLGEWVNLGADTTNSDLKNNYSSVRVHVDGKQVDSKVLLVGCFIGDHTKSAIGSRFNTGSVFGVCCLLYAAGFVPKYVPSFTWLGHERPVKYSVGKAIDTARTVMQRRGAELTSAKEKVLRGIYEREHA
ncbi:MAG: hypothetical protein KAW17_04645 [Candidatus Eisenbacteria sp.]|nr:hypothetical protein [Candidatus Eisenbacteria bacterium]